jgi:hypothetical protein
LVLVLVFLFWSVVNGGIFLFFVFSGIVHTMYEAGFATG